jgi:hypothetical protein
MINCWMSLQLSYVRSMICFHLSSTCSYQLFYGGKWNFEMCCAVVGKIRDQSLVLWSHYSTLFYYTSTVAPHIEICRSKREKKEDTVYSLLLVNNNVCNYKLYILRVHVLCNWGDHYRLESKLQFQLKLKDSRLVDTNSILFLFLEYLCLIGPW